MTPAQLQSVKIGLMEAGVRGVSRLDESEIVRLAAEHGLIPGAPAPAEPAQEPAPAAEPVARRRRASRIEPVAEPVAEPEPVVEPAPEPAPAAMQPLTAAPAAPSNADQVAQTIAAALGQLQVAAPAAPLDETKVIELIRQHAATPTYIAVNLPSRPEPKKVEAVTHECFDLALNFLALGKQIYFHGPSGAGKSFTAGLLADALDVPFFSSGSLLSKFEVLGSLTATTYHPSVIRQWLESENGLLCIDEIDASDHRALVTVMSLFDTNGRGCMTFPDGVTLHRKPEHKLIITGNTTGAGASAAYNGRVRLDKAFLNRFISMEHGWSDKIERSLAPDYVVTWLQSYRAALEELRFDGCLITPRNIVDAGHIATSDLKANVKRQMIETVVRQGLTDQQHRKVMREMSAGALSV